MENRAYPESAVLNDAILRASADLGHRDPTRRRILFIISDGREKGSTASYDDVKKVLLTNNITVFAVGVDTAAIPLYEKLARVRLPGQGYGNILPKYASATGGEVLAELTRSAIEGSYSRLTERGSQPVHTRLLQQRAREFHGVSQHRCQGEPAEVEGLCARRLLSGASGGKVSAFVTCLYRDKRLVADAQSVQHSMGVSEWRVLRRGVGCRL